MNKVLLVGNGFDLAHGLLTSYGDFLKIMKDRPAFNLAVDYYLEHGTTLETSKFYNYFKEIKSLNEDNIKKLQEILESNSWVEYFAKCGAEIDGWIDFEREIYPVIDVFEKIFYVKEYDVCNCDAEGIGEADIDMTKEQFNSSQIRIIKLWKNYLKMARRGMITVNSPYASKAYGILKKKILQSLRDEFDEFIKAFEIYLLEFVYRVENTEVLEQIKNINADYVISLNYTPTENWYGIDKSNVHHLHGVIREDLKEDKYGKNVNGEKNNMVMGVNEQKDQNMDFIYFVKYFQRIQKESGTRYKGFVDQRVLNKIGQKQPVPYELHVYGHSLDETDEDILKHLIGKINANGEFVLKPDKVVIYFYSQSDYEQKVINLIKLYGRSVVERQMEMKKFEFIPTHDTKCAI